MNNTVIKLPIGELEITKVSEDGYIEKIHFQTNEQQWITIQKLRNPTYICGDEDIWTKCREGSNFEISNSVWGMEGLRVNIEDDSYFISNYFDNPLQGVNLEFRYNTYRGHEIGCFQIDDWYDDLLDEAISEHEEKYPYIENNKYIDEIVESVISSLGKQPFTELLAYYNIHNKEFNKCNMVGDDVNYDMDYVWDNSDFFGTVCDNIIHGISEMVSKLFSIIKKQILASIKIQRYWRKYKNKN